jgi:hypothetical protein
MLIPHPNVILSERDSPLPPPPPPEELDPLFAGALVLEDAVADVCVVDVADASEVRGLDNGFTTVGAATEPGRVTTMIYTNQQRCISIHI